MHTENQMEKIVEQGRLFDFYGQLLTAHQQHIYRQLVHDDLSLIEIAEAEGISKQAVHDLVRRCTALMQKYEKTLGMIGRFERISEDVRRLDALAESGLDAYFLRRGIHDMARQIKKDLD